MTILGGEYGFWQEMGATTVGRSLRIHERRNRRFTQKKGEFYRCTRMFFAPPGCFLATVRRTSVSASTSAAASFFTARFRIASASAFLNLSAVQTWSSATSRVDSYPALVMQAQLHSLLSVVAILEVDLG